MNSKDLSKNREATGVRVDPLLHWRQQQTTSLGYLDAVEYRRIPSRQAPYFSVNGFICNLLRIVEDLLIWLYTIMLVRLFNAI